jgi:hypothetical protein
MTSTPVPLPRRTSRRRQLIAAALAVAVCVGFSWVAVSDRLDHGSAWWNGGYAEVRGEGPGTELRFDFRPGGQLRFGTTIRNRGLLPVTVTDVGDDSKVLPTVLVEANEADDVLFDPAAAKPFRPTRVPAGAELPVFVTMTMPDVEFSAKSSLFLDEIAASYTVLGVPRHEQVPLGFRLMVYSVDGYVPDHP